MPVISTQKNMSASSENCNMGRVGGVDGIGLGGWVRGCGRTEPNKTPPPPPPAPPSPPTTSLGTNLLGGQGLHEGHGAVQLGGARRLGGEGAHEPPAHRLLLGVLVRAGLVAGRRVAQEGQREGQAHQEGRSEDALHLVHGPLVVALGVQQRLARGGHDQGAQAKATDSHAWRGGGVGSQWGRVGWGWRRRAQACAGAHSANAWRQCAPARQPNPRAPRRCPAGCGSATPSFGAPSLTRRETLELAEPALQA